MTMMTKETITTIMKDIAIPNHRIIDIPSITATDMLADMLFREEKMEDTSDEKYLKMHNKYEELEKRQIIVH